MFGCLRKAETDSDRRRIADAIRLHQMIRLYTGTIWIGGEP